MKYGFRFLAISAFIFSMALSGNSFAEKKEKAMDFSESTIQKTLLQLKGKTVTVVLESGTEITGKLSDKGKFDHVIHLSELSGMSYFDSVIATDEIAAVKFRVRNQ